MQSSILKFLNGMPLPGKRIRQSDIVQLYTETRSIFFYRGKDYWIAHTNDGIYHLSDNLGNTQLFNSCRTLFEDARIDGSTLEEIWEDVDVDAC